ncbi:MAG: cytochrome c oxidase subunit II [Crocinitomicaceae bacterium]|nr:cytochrome c oxidase subunit II [Crocinitomicaceae bacterium]
MVTKLIILLVIVLGVVAAAQLMRLYELSAKMRKEGEHDISRRDNRLNAGLMLAFMIVLFGGFIWLMVQYGWVGRGEAASVHGHELDWLLNLNFVIVIAVFFLCNFLLFFYAWKYVKKPGVPAYYFPHDNKLEMVWTVIPAIVLAVIIIFGLRSWNSVTDQAPDDAVVVELFSKQFDWTARYSGEDNKLGKFDYKLTEDAKNELALMTTESIQEAIDSMQMGLKGIDNLESQLNDRHIMLTPEDRDAKRKDLGNKEKLIRLLHQMKAKHDSKIDKQALDDFIVKDTLYLCKGQEYEFNFRSKDVIHSAYFPHFRAQMNTVPGQTTRFKFTPDKTTTEMRESRGVENFNYVLYCNKICGGSHYKMKMIIVVLEKDAYDAWAAVKMNGVKNADGTYATVPAIFDAIQHPEKYPTAAPAAPEDPSEGETEEAEGGEAVEPVEPEVAALEPENAE